MRSDAGLPSCSSEKPCGEQWCVGCAPVLDLSDEAFEIGYVIGHGTSPEAEAVRVLRRFMCCKAGRKLVEQALVRPFRFDVGYRSEGKREERERIAAGLQALREQWRNAMPDDRPDGWFEAAYAFAEIVNRDRGEGDDAQPSRR